ncbi:unnamed protein product [Staurois parvus]|uniref:Uncharacterized protein n=1 Tax=Staurois parvus TaxID=386267 RepID=A0ABN9DUC7_9NEOB|nr:unnamed protein product [Staurois parvus]
MDTNRWHCWGYTDYQGTLIWLSTPHCLRDWHFPIYMRSAVIGHS